MNYVVLDLEWNQCPHGKSRENPRLPFEIIEIGAIKFNENREEIGRFDELIRPLVYRKLHFRTREVLPLNQEELEKARTFSPVVRDFLAWCGDDVKFVTWGSLDLSELQKNMDYYRIPNPLPRPLFYYDLQKMFSLRYDDGKSRCSLEDAVEAMGIEKTIPFHRAFDDTYYTAEIMKHMDLDPVKKYESLDYYRPPKSREEEITRNFGTYTKYVSRVFATKEEAMADKVVTNLRCCQCSLPVWRKIRWFSGGSGIYQGLVQCPKHGYVKGKIRIKKANGGGVFVVRTVKLADAEAAQHIRDKKEQLRERRKEKRTKKKTKKMTE